ncbi:hypothetical protein EPI10_007329 [Gossypium australe]|uniref:Uncharacterized protein n=1 Tax=Gossypium australe TaxID=47621 RepID=A0A5B6WWB0_9ROSI|nr:hypothetical protein EPI10_007329 [Gossypium australe]
MSRSGMLQVPQLPQPSVNPFQFHSASAIPFRGIEAVDTVMSPLKVFENFLPWHISLWAKQKWNHT